MTLFSDVVAGLSDVFEGLEVVVNVTHKSYVSDGGKGDPTYTTATRRAIVDRRQREVRTFAGDMSLSSASVLFLGAVIVNEHDVILLLDGTGGEVINVSSPVDQSGRLITEAYL
jgi:hypothetical protein